jgi:hypothetical protein
VNCSESIAAIWLMEFSFAERKMSDSILMQYLGFKPGNQWREYSFQVRYAAEDIRDFTLTILNEAFTSHRVRYQDAPDVCSLKLRRELIANPNHPSNTNFAISDIELDDYRAGHTAKSSNRLYGPKPHDES